MTRSRERRFTASPRAPAEARRFVRQQLAALLGAGDPDLLDQAELLTSELAANAVKAAPEEFAVVVGVQGGWLEVAVCDHAPGRPSMRDPGPDEPTGRGLRIVAAVAADWGTRADGNGGKSVWFRMPVHSPGPSS